MPVLANSLSEDLVFNASVHSLMQVVQWTRTDSQCLLFNDKLYMMPVLANF
jgi:hypothetical protein